MFAHTTHASLLQRLAANADPDAWSEFHERYGELIRAFARRRSLQPADCDDVLQEVLLSLSRAMPGFCYDPSKGKFRGYLKTVTLRAIFKRGAQSRGAVDLEHIEEVTRAAAIDEEIEECWEAEWRQYHVRRAMKLVESEFNEQDRRAFQRYALEARDVKQTAAELGLSVDQVYQAKSRIMKRLAKLIERQVSEEG